MKLNTEIYRRHPVRFDMVGRALPQQVSLSDGSVSEGLAKRIYRYALETLYSAGFKEAVQGWKVTVYTLDADEKPSDRVYCVQWENSNGGGIEVVGIFTRSGWPSLDHGLQIYR